MIKKIHGRVKRFHLCINFGITSTLTNYKIYAQMKISIGFVIVFLFWTGLAKAQEFHGGVTAGIVGSQVAGDGYSGFKKGGLYAGGYVSLDVSQRSALQKFGADFRTNNSLLNIRSENRTWDVWRLWTYGQFSDALVLSFFYQFK